MFCKEKRENDLESEEKWGSDQKVRLKCFLLLLFGHQDQLTLMIARRQFQGDFLLVRRHDGRTGGLTVDEHLQTRRDEWRGTRAEGEEEGERPGSVG